MIDFSKWSFKDIPYYMTFREFAKALREHGEYSCSTPTGTTPGKKWFCRRPYSASDEDATWYMGQYGEPYQEGKETLVPIIWMRVEIDYTGHYLERLGSKEMR